MGYNQMMTMTMVVSCQAYCEYSGRGAGGGGGLLGEILTSKIKAFKICTIHRRTYLNKIVNGSQILLSTVTYWTPK